MSEGLTLEDPATIRIIFSKRGYFCSHFCLVPSQIHLRKSHRLQQGVLILHLRL